MNEQRNKFWLPLVISSVLALGMYLGIKIKEMSYYGQSTQGFSKVYEALGYINAQYVSDVDEDKISTEAIQNIVNNLDPHSNYLTKEEVLEIAEHHRGNFDGIGVQFYVHNDTILISDVIKDGPSEKVGLESGDKIISINDSIVAGTGITSDGVIKLLKGQKNSDVTLGILQIKDKNLKDYTVTRGIIPIKSIDAAYMADSTTAYIKINRFNGDTFEEFMKAFDDLQTHSNPEHLIIDVRNNPGGYLGECVKLINQLFTEEKVLFVYTKGEKNKKQEYRSNGKPHFSIHNVAVLINESSASASEILAGAIQDNDRGIILGRRSFGKGLVQQDFPLSDGSSMRLTISKYYTASGRCIQKEYDGHEGYEDINTRLDNGELYSKDSINIVDTTAYKTIKGRDVFAGGGIIPDVYVPFDTIRYNEDFFSVRSRIVAFSFNNKFKGIKMLAKDFDTFKSQPVPAELYDAFEAYCRNEDPRISRDYFKKNVDDVNSIIKGQFAQIIFGKSYFYQINNESDEMVKKALKYVHLENPLGL